MPEGRPWDYDEDADAEPDGGLWQQASAAVAKVLGPGLGMRAANPFAPGVSSQGTESVTSYGDDPRAAAYAGDASKAAAVNSGLASVMGLGGLLQAGPIAAAKVLGGGYVGGKAGETIGDVVGAPGAGKVLGSLVGGGIGAVSNPSTVMAAMSEAGVGGLGGRIAAETLRQAPKAARVASQAAEVAAARGATAAAPVASVPLAAEGAVVQAAARPASKAYQVIHELARKGQRFEGKKIWLKLDAEGNPVGVITPGQAARLADSEKTWINNLWGKRN